MMTIEELGEIAQAERGQRDAVPHHVNVCVAAGCLSLQSDKVKEALEKEVKAHGQEACCKVRGVGCLGLCTAGPLVVVESRTAPAAEPGDGSRSEEVPRQEVLYQQVAPEDAPAIVEALGKEPVARIQGSLEQPFFSRQKKIVLENSGRIDPERIEEYIAADGYLALIDTLTAMTPAGVVQQINRSGLRGRGGAGYPTGLKWSTVMKSQGVRKFVICNGDEGDPGAFMDRAVLESDPHRVLEGMALAGYAVGAQQGYVYVRAEYPLAIKRLKIAIRQAEKMGLLGPSIGGTTFSFSIDIRLGAGAFVCGEETALISSIEGGRGTPRPRPPYPAEAGLWGYPTLINNVETFANVAAILRHGPEWFSRIGTGKSKGTKVFALAGCVANTGLIEVPMGMPLREIVFDIGGGVPDGKAFKAVQTGGPSGGCIPDRFLDMPVDYESLAKVGSIMGSGGMIIMDETSSMVDVAKYFMEFCMTESCGKCVPCRVGTAQMHDLLARLASGKGSHEELALLEKLCQVVRATSLCGLGQSAPNPVLSTLSYFRDEYLAKLPAAQPAAVEGA